MCLCCGPFVTVNLIHLSAGKQTTAEQVEEMLESGNAQIFTEGVSIIKYFVSKCQCCLHLTPFCSLLD